MKRLFILFVLALSSLVAMAADYTIYFDDTTGVYNGTVRIWAWGSSNCFGDDYNSRPTMTFNLGTGLYEYSFTYDGDVTGIIFSDNSDNNKYQFEDTIVNGNVYTTSGNTGKTLEEYSATLTSITIYFEKPDSWSKVDIYYWDNSHSGHVDASFPGVEVTDVDTNTGLYYYTIKNTGSYQSLAVIWDNGDSSGSAGSTQTDNITSNLTDGAVFGLNGYISTYAEYVAGSSDSGTATNTYTVYFDDTTSNWGQVYVYIWDTDSNNNEVYYSGTYPGTKMELYKPDESSTNTTLYYYTFTTTATLSANAKVLFSYDGDEDTSKKTDNYAFVNGATYSSTAMTTNANWFIYFDPTGITGTIASVTVHMWHSAFEPGDADYFEQTDVMTKDESDNSGYYVYSFYSNDALLGDEHIEVYFIVVIDGNSEGTTYGYSTQSNTTQESDWYLINNGIYGVSGLIDTNVDKSGYTDYTIYYKQSEDTDKDGSWTAVYAYVFDNANRSTHYTTNQSWPGDAMTSLGDGQWKYTFRAPTNDEAGMGIDFNNGNDGTVTGSQATQTSDMKFYNKALYEHHYDAQYTLGSTDVEDNTQTYTVGAEIYVSSVGYATIYSDSAYVLPKKGDKFGKTDVADDYYFKDNVHATAITSCSTTNTATAADGDGDTENESQGYAMTSWFAEGSVVPAKSALLIHSQKSDESDDAKFGTNDTEVPSSGRYYLARVPSDSELSTAQNISNNMLHGSSSYARTNVNNETTGYLFYKLANDESQGGLGFYYGNDNGAAFVSEPNKAWLAIPETDAANITSIKIIEEADDNTATGLGAITPAAAKRSGDAIYTLQGIRVNDMSKKGIYIVGGRKVVVR